MNEIDFLIIGVLIIYVEFINVLYLLIIDNELIEYYFLDVVIIEIFKINDMIVMIIKNVVMGIIIFMLGIEIFVYINEG